AALEHLRARDHAPPERPPGGRAPRTRAPGVGAPPPRRGISGSARRTASYPPRTRRPASPRARGGARRTSASAPSCTRSASRSCRSCSLLRRVNSQATPQGNSRARRTAVRTCPDGQPRHGLAWPLTLWHGEGWKEKEKEGRPEGRAARVVAPDQ